MDVYDRLDLMIRKADLLVPTVRFYSHTTTLVQMSEPCVLDTTDFLMHRLTHFPPVSYHPVDKLKTEISQRILLF